MSTCWKGRGNGTFAIPVGCALLALATVLWASSRSHEGADVQSESAWEIPAGVSEEVVDALLSAPTRVSSARTFLNDLEAAHVQENGESVAVLAWSETLDLPHVAEEALCAYRDRGSVTLMASGYLDLAGNVWGALLRHDDGAVDVMTVSTVDDSESEVRVARLEADGL